MQIKIEVKALENSINHYKSTLVAMTELCKKSSFNYVIIKIELELVIHSQCMKKIGINLFKYKIFNDKSIR